MRPIVQCTCCFRYIDGNVTACIGIATGIATENGGNSSSNSRRWTRSTSDYKRKRTRKRTPTRCLIERRRESNVTNKYEFTAVFFFIFLICITARVWRCFFLLLFDWIDDVAKNAKQTEDDQSKFDQVEWTKAKQFNANKWKSKNHIWTNIFDQFVYRFSFDFHL